MEIFNNIGNTISKFFGLKSEKNNKIQDSKNSEKDYYDNEIIKDILSEIKNLSVSDKSMQKDIESLRSLNIFMQALIAILIAVIGIFIPLIFNMHADRVDKAIETQTEMIDKKIESLKEQNALLIKLSVTEESKKTYKNK